MSSPQMAPSRLRIPRARQDDVAGHRVDGSGRTDQGVDADVGTEGVSQLVARGLGLVGRRIGRRSGPPRRRRRSSPHRSARTCGSARHLPRRPPAAGAGPLERGHVAGALNEQVGHGHPDADPVETPAGTGAAPSAP